MAERDEYIQEAYNELKKLSLDEQKRVEYELIEKAVRDYNTQMKSAEKRGIALGEKRGIEKRKAFGCTSDSRQESRPGSLTGSDSRSARDGSARGDQTCGRVET